VLLLPTPTPAAPVLVVAGIVGVGFAPNSQRIAGPHRDRGRPRQIEEHQLKLLVRVGRIHRAVQKELPMVSAGRPVVVRGVAKHRMAVVGGHIMAHGSQIPLPTSPVVSSVANENPARRALVVDCIIFLQDPRVVSSLEGVTTTCLWRRTASH
jgi:hypothetical protein